MQLKSIFFTLLAATSLTLLVSCDKDETTTPNTIVDVVVNGSDFSLLEAAVIHAGLVDALKGANLTVFAPTNQAFINAGFKDEAAIKAADKKRHRRHSQVSRTCLESEVDRHRNC